MRTFLFVILWMGLEQKTFAYLFGTDVKEGGEPSTCEVVFYDFAHRPTGICSAVLTDANKVTTAGHCSSELAPSNATASVHCGYRGSSVMFNASTAIEDSRPGNHFSENRSAVAAKRSRNYQSIENASINDLGEIEFAPPIAATSIQPVGKLDTAAKTDSFLMPMKGVPKGVSALKLRPGVECKVEGYGINGSGKVGVLKTASFHPALLANPETHQFQGFEEIDLRKLKTTQQKAEYAECWTNMHTTKPDFEKFAKLLQSLEMVRLDILPGDSGGPLYCRKSAHDPWMLIGVNSMTGVHPDAPAALLLWAMLNGADLVPVPKIK